MILCRFLKLEQSESVATRIMQDLCRARCDNSKKALCADNKTLTRQNGPLRQIFTVAISED